MCDFMLSTERVKSCTFRFIYFYNKPLGIFRVKIELFVTLSKLSNDFEII